MTDEDIEKRFTSIEKRLSTVSETATKAAKQSDFNKEEIIILSQKTKHLETRQDIILDRLAEIKSAQDGSALQSKKIRKNTLSVLVTLISAIVLNVLDKLAIL